MYKVFIDNHRINIVPQDMEYHFDQNVLQVYAPSQEDIRILVEYLSETSANIDVELNAENAENVWELLKKECPMVSAAGGLVKNDKDQYLFIFRNGVWDLPKGKVEKGEDIEKCAIREVSEECGFDDVVLLRELPHTYHIYFHRDSFVLKKTYWYEMGSNYVGKFKPQAEEGIEKVKWFSKDELSIPLSNTYRSIKEFLLKVT